MVILFVTGFATNNSAGPMPILWKKLFVLLSLNSSPAPKYHSLAFSAEKCAKCSQLTWELFKSNTRLALLVQSIPSAFCFPKSVSTRSLGQILRFRAGDWFVRKGFLLCSVRPGGKIRLPVWSFSYFEVFSFTPRRLVKPGWLGLSNEIDFRRRAMCFDNLPSFLHDQRSLGFLCKSKDC